MVNALIALVFGLASATLVARQSQRFSRELDAASRLAAAYRRAAWHLREMRHAGVGKQSNAEASVIAWNAHRAAALDVEIEWANLEMLVGTLAIDPMRRELANCAERAFVVWSRTSTRTRREKIRGSRSMTLGRQDWRSTLASRA